MLYFSTSPN